MADTNTDPLDAIFGESFSVQDKSQVFDAFAAGLPASEAGKQFSKIVDVQWRLDLVTNSSTARKVNDYVFIVRLTVEEDGQFRYIEFECAQEKMSELVQKLREASSQIERTTSYKV
ncbi:MAG: hypothetical protein EZS28_011465 [Streblomastix strix]|uniref:COMM domain-containing protein 3 n=1 Tax=Streblomastix strix TaxID=222440 RepID=A0A5J4WDG2_9EUKA|nr:MAG: hypothetical protein EZS28_011465 [Streblomastix strix]